MVKITLKGETRKLTGRKVSTLRKEGILPANIYGKKIKSLSIQVNRDEFRDVFKEAGETGLVELSVGKETRPVLIHAVQVDPVTNEVLHTDFLQVDLKEKVTAQVPVELSGESPAEKGGIGTVVQYINELTVEALPTDLPESFKVDAATLTEVDQLVAIKDLAFDRAKVEVQEDAETIIVKVEPPQKEEVVVAPVAEVPAEGEGVPVEGAAEVGEVATEESKPAEEKKS